MRELEMMKKKNNKSLQSLREHDEVWNKRMKKKEREHGDTCIILIRGLNKIKKKN